MARESLRLETGGDIATSIHNSTSNTISSSQQQPPLQQQDDGFVHEGANQNSNQATDLLKINAAAATTSAYDYIKSSSFVRLDNIQQHTLIRATNSSLVSMDHEPSASNIKSDGRSSIGFIGDTIFSYVDLSIVRNMIAQYITEVAIISVILIYLFYYFRKISQRPRLIGVENSDFYKHIRENLEDILCKRFSPLIYFWGTNPQTALFGYLLGNSSEKEMPRNKFKRQYLYVSDMQYLTSNVNLSEHYLDLKNETRGICQNPQQVATDNPVKSRPLVRLNAADLCAPTISLLDQNIRLALESMARSNDKGSSIPSMSDRSCGGRSVTNTTGSDSPSSETESTESTAPFSTTSIDENDHKNCVTGMQDQTQPQQQQQQMQQQRPRSYCEDKHHHGRDKPLGSSSGDSGVFASNSSSSASSSASSLTINIENNSDETRCNCLRLYRDNSVERFDQPKTTTTTAAAKTTKTTTLDCDNYQQINERFDGLDNSEPSINRQQPLHQDTTSTIHVERERFEFGQCALDWFQDSHRNYHRNKLVALISAGMTTGSDKKYVTDTVATLNELGYEVCVFIRRGVGGLKLSSARFFSPSKWRDFEAAIHNVRRQRPNARLVAIGFSFGSIELCRYLAMSGERSLVDAALLVSCPFDPEAGGKNMRERALNRRIDAYLAKNLGKQLYQALFGSVDSQTLNEFGIEKDGSFTNKNGSTINLTTLPKVKSLVDFETKYNRVIQNYPNSEAYAADSRLHEHLTAIKTPTLCISSEDDFMAPLKLLPLEQIKQNKNICMILTKRGGHMAFVDGLVWPTKPYFAQRIVNRYLGAFKLKNLNTDTDYSAANMNNSTKFNQTGYGQQQINAQKENLQNLIKVFR